MIAYRLRFHKICQSGLTFCKGMIELDKGDYLHIVFEIEGLLASDY